MQTRSSVPAATELLQTYTSYDAAQQTVDQLSDAGFPVEEVSIVWARLRRVEHVTGRRTTLRALVEGLGTGVWVGALFALILSLFVELDDGISWIAMVLWYALIGAIVIGAWTAVAHWMRRGRRDFGTIDQLDAERYEVWVTPEVADRARMALGISDERPMDPEPAATREPARTHEPAPRSEHANPT